MNPKPCVGIRSIRWKEYAPSPAIVAPDLTPEQVAAVVNGFTPMHDGGSPFIGLLYTRENFEEAVSTASFGRAILDRVRMQAVLSA